MSTVSTAPTQLEPKRYTAGTLSYTKWGLAVLFAWLLWGDFCFTIMEDVLPRIFPLYMLDTLGSNNRTTALFMSIIPQIFGIMVGPAVSFKSDRYRSKWGRRIPFIMWTAPFIVMALIGLGFSEHFHHYFQVASLPETLHVHPMTATLAIIGFFMILFCFMNEFVNSVFWYLFADVVPEEFLGRFLGLFRLMGTLAHFLFNVFVFKYAQSHMEWIFLGAGALYLFGFSAMCLKVKEGEYPPPDDLGEKPSVLKQATVYLRECFGHPLYILLFIYTGCKATAATASIGGIIFNKDALGITLEQMGYVAGASNFITMFLQYPSGWLVDRFHPLRMTLAMQVIIVPITFAMYFFMVGFKSYVAFEGLKLIFFALHAWGGEHSAADRAVSQGQVRAVLLVQRHDEVVHAAVRCGGRRVVHRRDDCQRHGQGRLSLDVHVERGLPVDRGVPAAGDLRHVEGPRGRSRLRAAWLGAGEGDAGQAGRRARDGRRGRRRDGRTRAGVEPLPGFLRESAQTRGPRFPTGAVARDSLGHWPGGATSLAVAADGHVR